MQDSVLLVRWFTLSFTAAAREFQVLLHALDVLPLLKFVLILFAVLLPFDLIVCLLQYCTRELSCWSGVLRRTCFCSYSAIVDQYIAAAASSFLIFNCICYFVHLHTSNGLFATEN